MKEKANRKNIHRVLQGAVMILLIAASFRLLGSDAWVFNTWWLLALILGIVFMPVTGLLFRTFQDKGWMFSKVLAIAAAGFLEWFLVSIGWLKFNTLTCVGVTVLLAAGNVFFLFRQNKHKIECMPMKHLDLVVWEEILFFAVFLMWTYLAGFHPNAYGTEKFMDYGFMEAMMRSDVLPARDLWYSEGHINYYYGGQYFAVFLTKLSGSSVSLTYNLMRTFVAGLAFIMPFSLVYQMASDRFLHKPEKKLYAGKRCRKWVPYVSGITAGIAVSIAGNMHYVIYACIIPFIQKITGEEISGYWFPDATRYIGFNPDRPDKTIHEFPCYSFVLGDLHAHVVNIMFVLLLIGILYAYMSLYLKKRTINGRVDFLREALRPHILAAAFLLGMYRWTNYWDFIIYFVVSFGVILFVNIAGFAETPKRVLLVTVMQAAEILLISTIIILPFTLQFETMFQGIALAQYHSLPHQLLVLWGLPALLTILFIAVSLYENIHNRKLKTVSRLMRYAALPDVFSFGIGLCAIGLVLIPEIVYVRDIYENGNARANTMFKLTYQAYILFGLMIGYAAYRLLVISRQKAVKIITGILLFFFFWTVGYFGESVDGWFGNVLEKDNYQGLYALGYLETDFAEDAQAVYWLKDHVDGTHVVLEANGDSYTGYERVSASTGLPTILGWYVHEWLWRNDVADINDKAADVETIYTSEDLETVTELIDQYEVEYIFIGSREYEKYGDALNVTLLKSLGEVVFRDENSSTCIVKIGD